ncbi:MAG: 30S ribosomal protein S16 [FCB group bacterium]|jgi:small subunit ribosomal protein S16
MVRLRLRRKGRTHYPIYDIIAIDGRKRRDGAFIERLGYFNPHSKPTTISVDADKAIYWLNQGAQPTDIVRNLLSYEGVLLQRHMRFKGKSEEEITETLEKHKANVKDRYFKRKESRKVREGLKNKPAQDTPAMQEANSTEEDLASEETPASSE